MYVHEAARALIEDSSDPRSLLAASIVVHEFTHYLQAANRSFNTWRSSATPAPVTMAPSAV